VHKTRADIWSCRGRLRILLILPRDVFPEPRRARKIKNIESGIKEDLPVLQ